LGAWLLHVLLPGWAATSLISRSTCSSSAARTLTFQTTRAQSRHAHTFFQQEERVAGFGRRLPLLTGQAPIRDGNLVLHQQHASNAHTVRGSSSGEVREARRGATQPPHYSVKTEHIEPDVVRVALPRGKPRILDRHRPVGHEQPKLILAPDSRFAHPRNVTPGARPFCARGRAPERRAAAGQGGGARTIEGSWSNASLMAVSTRGPSTRVPPSSSATSGWFSGMLACKNIWRPTQDSKIDL
jgi:hypothetical protein